MTRHDQSASDGKPVVTTDDLIDVPPVLTARKGEVTAVVTGVPSPVQVPGTGAFRIGGATAVVTTDIEGLTFPASYTTESESVLGQGVVTFELTSAHASTHVRTAYPPVAAVIDAGSFDLVFTVGDPAKNQGGASVDTPGTTYSTTVAFKRHHVGVVAD
ncbi:hypothetical protein [Embleya sp. NPDC059259]|uniref:hypothetical protein n=1 Tax=unclassified Embleya TaxID=2699296 RepID=UPI0036984789